MCGLARGRVSGSELRSGRQSSRRNIKLPYRARRRPKKGAPAAGTLGWLVARYRETIAWSSLSPTTRRQRENILRHVLDSASGKPFVHVNQQVIAAGRDRRATTPAQARHFLDTMRGLFKWAKSAGLVKTDPTAGVEKPTPK